MIQEYEHVRIKATGVTGIVVDIRHTTAGTFYVVESDEKGVPGGRWEADENAWSLLDCADGELEKID